MAFRFVRPQELVHEFIRTGTEVEGVDTVGDVFDHVLTACAQEPHPGSDHMWVTMVDVGGRTSARTASPCRSCAAPRTSTRATTS